MFQFVLGLATLALVSGDVVNNGNCPDLKPVSNFNTTAYLGVWWEAAKYPFEAEKNGKCPSAEYTLQGESILLKNSHIINSTRVAIDGTVKLAPDAAGAGKLIVSLKFGDKTRESPLWVLATDYTGYSIVYSCRYDEKNKNHQDFAWILSRSKKLEGTAKAAADTFIKATPELDATKFQESDFSEESCKFNNAAVITQQS